ncbi:MAG: gamma-glutamyltransferase [Burkholderiales bacterium]|nr:gamma-glutamyltransferase [Burkholderiales bacterium]
MLDRSTIMGSRHLIVAGHYLAAQAGYEILQSGGNAIDAGVAAGMVLGVVQSERVNFGGVAPQVIYLAHRREIHCIDGVGGWPRAITPDFFEKNHDGVIPAGVLRSVMPAAPDAWLTALRCFGTMSFADVASASIRLAREGFPMYPLMANWIAGKASLFQRWAPTAKIYLPGGRPPAVGELFVQTDLGNTLQYLADVERANAHQGRDAALLAARDAFYKGDIATSIVKYHQEAGGLVQREDLESFSVRFEPTVRGKFKDIEVHSCGPWSQGPVVPMTLGILEHVDLASMGHNSVRYIHHVTEALKLAFADRHQHFGDPAFVDVPMTGLMSDGYSAYRRGLIDANRACPGMPFAGDPARCTALAHRWVPEPRPSDEEVSVTGDTSYLCCVDRHGNAFSATPSDGPSNSPVIPGTGMVCSGRGLQSWSDPTHPCSVAPGKRPRLTPNPAVAFKDGKLFMPFGTPGGDVQCQAMVQLFLNINVFKMDPQAAADAPRFVTFSFPNTHQPHDYFPSRLYLEGRIARAIGDQLERMGHEVRWWDDATSLAGGVCLITADPQSGLLAGGADSRRPTCALGW